MRGHLHSAITSLDSWCLQQLTNVRERNRPPRFAHVFFEAFNTGVTLTGEVCLPVESHPPRDPEQNTPGVRRPLNFLEGIYYIVQLVGFKGNRFHYWIRYVYIYIYYLFLGVSTKWKFSLVWAGFPFNLNQPITDVLFPIELQGSKTQMEVSVNRRMAQGEAPENQTTPLNPF